jgi:crotonobetainyl-CoA:carnitine CoA-transferase CaiB-like acyl-CoA transferase
VISRNERTATLVLSRPEGREVPSARERVRRADELDRIVGEWIGARHSADVMAAFEAAGAAIAPIYDVEQVLHDPHVQATEMITTVQDDSNLGRLATACGWVPGGLRSVRAAETMAGPLPASPFRCPSQFPIPPPSSSATMRSIWSRR